jgi:excisionase family DNA binding protein
MSEEPRKLLMVREVAERQRLSMDSVKRTLRNKRLGGHKVGTRGDWRITYEQYESWLSEGAPTSPKKPEEEPSGE